MPLDVATSKRKRVGLRDLDPVGGERRLDELLDRLLGVEANERVLPGFPGAAGTFRRPPAGSVRDALVV